MLAGNAFVFFLHRNSASLLHEHEKIVMFLKFMTL